MPAIPVVKRVVRSALSCAGRSRPGQRLLHFYDYYGLIPDRGVPAAAPSGSSTGELIRSAPTEMSQEERGFLYALARGAAPRRVLEIGTAEGGSSLVLATALEENGGPGRVYTIDPVPRISFDQRLFHGRVEIVAGVSPEAVEEAAARADGPFDLVLVDGIHIYDQTKKDLAAALRHTAESAYVLLHDSFHYGVAQAVRELVEADPRLHDCGYVCNRPRPVGELATHAGFRLLRVGEPVVDVDPLVEPVWQGLGLASPNRWELRNHDFWYCSAVEACDHCRAQQPAGAASAPSGAGAPTAE